VELNGKASFSEIVGSRVRDQSGRSLGRVLEVRAHWQGDGSIVIDELLVGRRALWQRLRGPDEDVHGIPWPSVVDLDQGEIVVSR